MAGAAAGRLQAYITPEEYEANAARMARDRQTAASRALRGTGRRCCPGCCAVAAAAATG